MSIERCLHSLGSGVSKNWQLENSLQTSTITGTWTISTEHQVKLWFMNEFLIGEAVNPPESLDSFCAPSGSRFNESSAAVSNSSNGSPGDRRCGAAASALHPKDPDDFNDFHFCFSCTTVLSFVASNRGATGVPLVPRFATCLPRRPARQRGLRRLHGQGCATQVVPMWVPSGWIMTQVGLQELTLQVDHVRVTVTDSKSTYMKFSRPTYDLQLET